MIYNKVTTHKQAGVYECLHYKTNMGTWTRSLNHSRYNRKEIKTKQLLCFNKCQVSGEDLKTDYEDLLYMTLWDVLVGKLSLRKFKDS